MNADLALGPRVPPTALHEDVLRVVWQEARPLRADLHRMLGVLRCDTALSSGTLHLGGSPPGVRPGGLFVGGTCPCRDYVVDLLLEAQRFLAAHATDLRNAAAAVRVHLRTRGAADWIRGARVARGALARPERLRRQVIGRGLREGLERALLEYVADEAGSPAPLDGPQHLLDRLADRAAREFGGTRADHRAAVAAALPNVERACRAGRRAVVDGVVVTWWERYVEAPLGRRPRWSDESLDVPGRAGTPAPEVRCPSADTAGDALLDELAYGSGGVDAVVLSTVLAASEQGGGGPSAEAAVVRAVRTLARNEVIPDRVAERFAGDRARVQAVAVLAAELGAGARPPDPDGCGVIRGPAGG